MNFLQGEPLRKNWVETDNIFQYVKKNQVVPCAILLNVKSSRRRREKMKSISYWNNLSRIDNLGYVTTKIASFKNRKSHLSAQNSVHFQGKKKSFFSSGHRFHIFTYIFLQLSKACQALHPCIMKVSTNISFVNDGYFNIWQWIYVTWLMVLRSTCWYVCLGPGTAHTSSKLMFISNSVSAQHHTLGLTNCLN